MTGEFLFPTWNLTPYKGTLRIQQEQRHIIIKLKHWSVYNSTTGFISLHIYAHVCHSGVTMHGAAGPAVAGGAGKKDSKGNLNVGHWQSGSAERKGVGSKITSSWRTGLRAFLSPFFIVWSHVCLLWCRYIIHFNTVLVCSMDINTIHFRRMPHRSGLFLTGKGPEIQWAVVGLELHFMWLNWAGLGLQRAESNWAD